MPGTFHVNQDDVERVTRRRERERRRGRGRCRSRRGVRLQKAAAHRPKPKPNHCTFAQVYGLSSVYPAKGTPKGVCSAAVGTVLHHAVHAPSASAYPSLHSTGYAVVKACGSSFVPLFLSPSRSAVDLFSCLFVFCSRLPKARRTRRMLDAPHPPLRLPPPTRRM